MAEDGLLPGNWRVTGTLRPAAIDIPANSVDDVDIKSGANVAATKLEHQYDLKYTQDAGAAVVSATRNLHIVRGATGSVISVEAMVDTAPTGADRTITIDVQKGNQSTAFATLLAATLVINNTTAAREVKTASLVASPTLADGDTVRVVVTVAGAAGAQGQGLNVTIMVREKADP